MSLRQPPKVNAFQRPRGFNPDAPASALDAWANMPVAAAVTDGNIIEINDVIGEDWWTGGGFTSNRMSAALRAIGANEVTVMVNSPGGDVFEGLAIYNMLALHPAKVTVQVMGLAASAASVIAMAGDQVVMAAGAMMMIHNAWGVVIGNRNDMQAGIDLFGKIDASMAEIYASKTGMKAADISAMMDGPSHNSDGTWLTAQEAVDQHFADTVTTASTTGVTASRADIDPAIMARRRVDAHLAQQGLPRSERRTLLRDLKGTSGAAPDPAADITPSADETQTQRDISRLLQAMKV